MWLLVTPPDHVPRRKNCGCHHRPFFRTSHHSVVGRQKRKNSGGKKHNNKYNVVFFFFWKHKRVGVRESGGAVQFTHIPFFFTYRIHFFFKFDVIYVTVIKPRKVFFLIETVFFFNWKSCFYTYFQQQKIERFFFFQKGKYFYSCHIHWIVYMIVDVTCIMYIFLLKAIYVIIRLQL